ncbi:MAG: trigger factor [Pseudomonadota bacterium]
MQVTETLNEGLKRGYAITLTAAELDAKVDEKLEAVRPQVQMKGFRKGKAPHALLKKMYGKSVLGEAMQEAIDGAMRAHFEETGDRPAMQPDVKMTNEAWEEGQDVEVALEYEALPTVPEVDFAAITVEKLVAEVDDAAVEEALQNLAAGTEHFEAKTGAAEEGDQVVLDFEGRIDGEAFDGGAAEDFPLTLGSGQFIPGFEEQLIGAKAEEARDVTVSFPEDYNAAQLAGKEAVFACTIKEVKAKADAPVDDSLATHYGLDDLDALKGQIKERLAAEYAGAARTVQKRRLLDALDGAVSFEVPPTMLESEAKQIAHQLHNENEAEEKAEGAEAGAAEDERGDDHDRGDDQDQNQGPIEPTEEHRTLAERRVRLGLLLAEIGSQAEITVTDAELNQAVVAQARQYPGQEKAFFEFVRQNEGMMQQIRAPLFEDKVVDHLFEQITVSEKTVSKDELQEAIEALDDA